MPAGPSYSVQVVREDGFTLVGGVRVHYEAWGEGDPVVLIHGLGSCAAAFRAVGPFLAEAGYRAVAIDLPGCGLSARSGPGFTRKDLSAVVLGFLDNLSIDRVRALVGHSMGAAIALELAATRPERVELLAVLDCQGIVSTPRLLAMSAPLSPVVGELAAGLTALAPMATRRLFTRLYLRRIFRDPLRIPEELVEAYATCADAGYQRAMFGMLRHLGDTAGLAAAVRTLPQPALLVWGEDDVVCPRHLADELHRALPDAELKLLSRCGHSPAEERPEELAGLLVDFFARRGPRVARPAVAAHGSRRPFQRQAGRARHCTGCRPGSGLSRPKRNARGTGRRSPARPGLPRKVERRRH